jgi:nucleotide-binding universal stress UspA family protein
MPFERILIAIDFSSNSLEAFRVAAEMARVHSASLHLLHVVEAQPALPPGGALELVQKANAAVERLVSSSQAELDATTFTTEVASGRAFDEIVKRARDWAADLIVLGAKGATSLEQIVLGGTAEQVIKDTRASVLIVRPAETS